jgi:YVTN family beta-propeller protein
VDITPNGSFVYVTNQGNNTVSVIATVNNTVVATIPVMGVAPFGVTISPNGTLAYVTNLISNTVSVINTGTNTVIATIPVGTRPFAVALNADGTRAYVANSGSDTVSVIDTTNNNTVIATINVGDDPIALVVSPNGTRVYVANQSSHTVSVINTANNTVVATILVGAFPSGIAITPDGASVYVTNQGSGYVSVINTATNNVTANIATTGSCPFGIAITERFNPNAGTTAASVSVSGRVVTTQGRGVRNVVVTMTDSNGDTRTATTTNFGYYRFEEVAAGETYIFAVRGKRFSFGQNTQVHSIIEDTNNINFVANEQSVFLVN